MRDWPTVFLCHKYLSVLDAEKYYVYMANYEGTDIYCDRIIPTKSDGERQITVVKETVGVIAYYHTKPHWPVHIVVTPKRHVPSLLELEDEPELAQELLGVINGIAQEVMEREGAARVLTNFGEYQDSKHLHFHISNGRPIAQ